MVGLICIGVLGADIIGDGGVFTAKVAVIGVVGSGARGISVSTGVN